MNILSLFDTEFSVNVSDLHLTAGLPPVIRRNGQLEELPDYPVLTDKDIEEAARSLLTERQYELMERNGDIDLSRFIGSGNKRVRINIFRQRGALSVAIRFNAMKIKTAQELGLPPCVLDMCRLKHGLILVTGPTGVGKTTTMATMIDWINKNRRCHIITVEDPIEYIFRNEKSIINQRQIGSDSPTFAAALKSILRQDPDVIVLGEMRDLESISTALTAAETGQLVISSLHTIGAVKTIDRIIDVFPPSQQQQVRIQLSTVLQGIISQQLIPRADGSGRVLATEVMLNIPAAQNLIRTEKTHQLQNVILTSMKLGMQSMDKSIADYLRAGIIDMDQALTYCTDKEAMTKLVKESPAVKKI